MQVVFGRKFLGRLIQLQHVQIGLGSLWNPQQEWEVIPMNHGFFIFPFTSLENKDRVLLGSLWVLNGHVLVAAMVARLLTILELFASDMSLVSSP